jgi:hypothetical protein
MVSEASFESDIKKMQDLFAVLKHEYDLYFAGTRKTQPAKERAELDRLVKVYGNGTLNRMSQQFLLSAFTSKFTLHCEQWNKWLRAKEDGLVSDPRLQATTREAKKALYALEKSSPGQARTAGKPAAAAAVPQEVPPREKVGMPLRGLYDEFISAKLECGMVPEWDFDAFEKHLKKQRDAILAKYAGKDVVFSVQNSNGKVSLKAKVIK